MIRISRLPSLHLITLGLVVLWAAGCHSNQTQNAANQAAQPQQDDQSAPDPATANLAPVASGGTDYATSDNNENPPPAQDSADEETYGIQPEDTAPQPPPPLPEYDQPPCPGDNYIWTPGYWNYAQAGYYWVPGAWVEAPYAGALWTPGYWDYSRGRYNYFPGYWGNYVGFYGGINYGFGYTGVGYHGGYWRNRSFNYNRTVNNINTNEVHNYYNYRISGNRTSRVSFNGGHGGVEARPRVAELAALRQPRVPPMTTQVQLRKQAMGDHSQFAQANHGRPAQAAFKQPVAAERGVHPTAQPVRNLPAGARVAPETARNAQPAAQPEKPQVNRMGPPRTAEHQPEPVYPETNRPAQKYAQPMHSQAKPGEPTRPQSNLESPHGAQPQQQPNRPQPNRPSETRQQPNRPQAAHTEPGRTPAARPQPSRTEPEHAPAARPQPSRAEPQRAPAARPQPSRTEPNHPAAHPQPEQRKPEERKPSPDQHEEHK